MDFVLGRRSEYNLSCQTHFYAQTSVSIVQLMYFWKAKGPKYVVFISPSLHFLYFSFTIANNIYLAKDALK